MEPIRQYMITVSELENGQWTAEINLKDLKIYILRTHNSFTKALCSLLSQLKFFGTGPFV
jgi:hypothetical protein